MIASAAQLEVLRPKKLREALTMLRDAGPLIPLAGGTDLLVQLNAYPGGGTKPGRFLDLWGLDELRGITRDGRTLTFGALATYTDCIRSGAVDRLLPILASAAAQVGGVQIQNRGTLGGNIGNASPAADAVPVLACADAEVVLASREEGEREVPLSAYYTGYRQSVRRPDELIVRIRVRVPKGRQVFRKVGPRAAQAISKIVLAAIGPQIAIGSVAPTVVRPRKLEAYLQSGGRDAGEAARLLFEEIAPIDDVRSTAAYRKRVAANLVAELVDSLF